MHLFLFNRLLVRRGRGDRRQRHDRRRLLRQHTDRLRKRLLHRLRCFRSLCFFSVGAPVFKDQRRELVRKLLRSLGGLRPLLRFCKLLLTQRLQLLFVVLHRLWTLGQNVRPMLRRLGCFFLRSLAAAVFHKDVRPNRRVLLSLLPGLRLHDRHGRVVHREIKFRHAGALALRALDLLLRHMIDDHLRRVGMLPLRLGIFRPWPLPDGGQDTADGHVQAGNQLQQQRRQQHDRRADAADNGRQQLREESGEDAAARAGNAAVPQLAEHLPRPFQLAAAGKNVRQRADGRRQQKRARHAQRNGPSVMQQQNQEAQQEGKRQYVEARSDRPLEQGCHQIQHHRVYMEAAQDRKNSEEQAHKCADLTPHRTRGRFLSAFTARAALGAAARRALRGRRVFLLFLFCHSSTSRHK